LSFVYIFFDKLIAGAKIDFILKPLNFLNWKPILGWVVESHGVNRTIILQLRLMRVFFLYLLHTWW